MKLLLKCIIPAFITVKHGYRCFTEERGLRPHCVFNKLSGRQRRNFVKDDMRAAATQVLCRESLLEGKKVVRRLQIGVEDFEEIAIADGGKPATVKDNEALKEFKIS